MVTHLRKGDLDRPAQDKPLHDLDRLGLLISRQQGHRLVLALGIANEDPTDRDRRDRRLVPQSRARRDFHRACGSPIPGQRVVLPLRGRIAEALSQFGLRFAFERISTAFASFTRRGRIIQTGIQPQAGDDAHAWQVAHASRRKSSTA